MKMTCRLLVVALLLLSPRAWAQDSPGSAVTPDAAAPQAQGGDVLWYGKAPPGWGGVVTDMKLLAPGIGWAHRGHYYWTTDNGANWTDITPPSNPGSDERISDFYFLDTHRGWALFARYDKEEPQFDVASTTDAGATWTRTHLALPPPANYGNPDRMPLSGWGGTIAFLDPLHGWMNITLSLSMHSFISFLLVTSDGGGSWRLAPSFPALAGADMLLVTPSDGWMIGTSLFSDKELFVTHDGTKSWQQVLVDTPKDVLPARLAQYYELPTFEDSKHGLLSVYYSGGVGVKPATVLFATSDGGRTWKPDRMVTNQEDGSPKYSTSAVVDSVWIFAAVSDHQPTLTRLSVGEKIDASADAATSVSHYKVARQLSFATPTQGWVIVGDGELISTTDGGATWTTLLPGPQPHVIQPHGSFIPRQSIKNPTPPAAPASPPNGGGSP